VKAQFKYAFSAGLTVRGGTFAVILLMNLVFILFGVFGMLPFAANVTAVALCGTGVAVMMALNLVGDIAIARRMFAAPGAYLYALTPVPRWKPLLASVVAMLAADVVTMTFPILGVTWLSLRLAGESIGAVVWDSIRGNASDWLFGLWFIALMLAGYLFIVMVILFCAAMKKSVFYQKPAGGLLTALTALGAFYVHGLSSLLLAPLGVVERWGWWFLVTVGRTGIIAYLFLVLIQAAALFAATARLMERKMNI